MRVRRPGRTPADAVATGLRREAMAVDVVYEPRGRPSPYRGVLNDYDVVVLDRDLPLVHGDDVCRKIVELAHAHARAPMLTASGDVSDRVEGLENRADDYLPKPFAFSELTARVRAPRRRTRRLPPPPVLERAGIKLDPNRREVFRDEGGPARAQEFAVLEVLLRSEGAVVSAEQLLEKAWTRARTPSPTSSVSLS